MEIFVAGHRIGAIKMFDRRIAGGRLQLWAAQCDACPPQATGAAMVLPGYYSSKVLAGRGLERHNRREHQPGDICA
ncbi:MAG: hypothetical protein KGL39_29980 [Patescibacteria group bacterium]|nr:hypothetical protein [Patescibacteria group bacterium]